MNQADYQALNYLKDHIIKTYDLPEFIETQSQVDLKWARDGEGAICECPMPDHAETKPSFHINRIDDVWLYHCFGCQKKGTIIHFCIDALGLRNQNEAVKWLCNYYKVEGVDDIVLQGMKNISKRVDNERQLENENILVSNQCRMLLKKDLETHKNWVAKAYRSLNEALLEQDFQEISRIGNEAFKRTKMKNEK